MELKKQFTYWITGLLQKGHNMGICIVHMQDLGKGHGVSRCSPTLKLCEPIHLGFLGEASLHRHD